MNQHPNQNPDQPSDDTEQIGQVSAEIFILLSLLSTARKKHPEFTNQRFAELIKEYGAAWDINDSNFQKALKHFEGDYNQALKDGRLKKPEDDTEDNRNTIDNIKEKVRELEEHKKYLAERDNHLADNFIKNLNNQGVTLTLEEQAQIHQAVAEESQRSRTTANNQNEYATHMQQVSVEAVRTATINDPEKFSYFRDRVENTATSVQPDFAANWNRPSDPEFESRVNRDITRNIFAPQVDIGPVDTELYAVAYRNLAFEHGSGYDPEKIATEAAAVARKTDLAFNNIEGEISFGNETHFFEALGRRLDATPMQQKFGPEIDRQLNQMPQASREKILTVIIGDALEEISQKTDVLTKAVGAEAARMITANIQNQTPGSNNPAAPGQAGKIAGSIISEITAVNPLTPGEAKMVAEINSIFTPKTVQKEILQTVAIDAKPHANLGSKHDPHIHLPINHTNSGPQKPTPQVSPQPPSTNTTMETIIILHEETTHARLPDQSQIQKLPAPSGGFGWVKEKLVNKFLGMPRWGVTSKGFIAGANALASRFSAVLANFLKAAAAKLAIRGFAAAAIGALTGGLGTVAMMLPEIINKAKGFIKSLFSFGGLGDMFSGRQNKLPSATVTIVLALVLFFFLSPVLIGSAFSPSTIGIPDPLVPAGGSPVWMQSYRAAALIKPIYSNAGMAEGEDPFIIGPANTFVPGAANPFSSSGWPASGCIIQGPFTGAFGGSHTPYNAIDITAGTGAPVYSVMNGVIGYLHEPLYPVDTRTCGNLVKVVYDANGNPSYVPDPEAKAAQAARGYPCGSVNLGGNDLRVDGVDANGNVFSTYYAHLAAYAAGISLNTPIKEGQLIGYADNTGNSSGAHLHFGYSGGDRLDSAGTILPYPVPSCLWVSNCSAMLNAKGHDGCVKAGY
jgi:murein DD-endopeptidase MepM/ murein hydrolase activator NlpD